jgi:hypothetical protein
LTGETLALPSVVEDDNGVCETVAVAVDNGTGVVGGSSIGARGPLSDVASALGTFSTACDSRWDTCGTPSTSSSGAIETAFLAIAILRASSSGMVAFRASVGTFLLNHRNDATTDTIAKSTVEGESPHDFWRCKGTLATHSHGTTGVCPSPRVTCGSLPAYACEFEFSEWAGPPLAVGRGGVAGPGTPSSRRARRERLSALSARTPVKHRRSVVPSKHCSMPFSVETTTPSAPSMRSTICVGTGSLKATRGK